jgi:hypothetical protein
VMLLWVVIFLSSIYLNSSILTHKCLHVVQTTTMTCAWYAANDVGLDSVFSDDNAADE